MSGASRSRTAQGQRPASKRRQHQQPHDDWADLELHAAWEPILIPEGDYDAKAVKADPRPTLGGRRKLFLWFEILGGPHGGRRLFQVFTLPVAGQQVSPASRYYEAWTRANAGQRPGRFDRMSPRIFKDRLFIIRVRTVVKDHRGNKKPADRWYSVVEEILS